MINLCDILNDRYIRGIKNESLLFKTLEDSFLANYETEPEDLIEPTDNPLSTIAIAVSPDGDTVATTHGDHTVKVFKLSSGAPLRTFRGHPRTPWTVKYNPADASILASGCLGFEVRVWDVLRGKLLNLIRLDSCVITLAFHPTGDFILASSGPRLHTWRWREGAAANHDTTESSSKPPGSPSGRASHWQGYRASRTRVIAHSRNIRAVVFHPSGRFVFVAAPDPPISPDPARGPTAANRLYGFPFASVFSHPPYIGPPEPIPLMSLRTVIPEIHLYSDGGIDVSRDGRYLVTGALAYVPSTPVGNTPLVNTQGISSIEQLERLPHFWTNESLPDQGLASVAASTAPSTAIATADTTAEATDLSLQLSSRSAHFHPGANVPSTFPSVTSGSASSSSSSSASASGSSSRRRSHPSSAVLSGGPRDGQHRPPVESAAPWKPVFFDPISDRVEATIGLRPQELLCLFHIVESAVEAPASSSDGARRAADQVSLDIVQYRDISSSLMKAVTSIKFSPTSRVAVLAYGVRREGAVEGHPLQNVACEVIRFSDDGEGGRTHTGDSLKTVAIIANAEDEVNIAQFHAIPGAGIIYGTKQGKVRIYRHRLK